MLWDVAAYEEFAGPRARPFLDLLARVGAEAPARVVDLGAGTGDMTRLLTRRWPQADVVAVDNSPAMTARARQHPELTVVEADLRTWRPPQPVDVIVTNAALQWIPGHLDLIERFVDQLRPGGWFALQVPGNFDQPSHAWLKELGRRAEFRPYLGGIEHPASHAPADYLHRLQACGCTADVWETTYLQVLTGPDAVFRFVASTGARPTLQALPATLRDRFEAEYRAALRAAYPEVAGTTVFPFRRIFAVGQRPA